MSKLFTRSLVFLFLVGSVGLVVWSYSYAPLPTRIRKLAHQLSEAQDVSDSQAQRDLQQMGEQAYPTLQGMLSHSHWQTRRAAVQAMAVLETREQSARKSLKDALHDQEWRVRKMAAYALGQKGWYSASAVTAMADALMREKEWQVRREIAQALGQIGPAAQPAAEALEKKLQDKDWSVRTAALRSLVRIYLSPDALVPVLEQTLQDPNWQVRELAAQLSNQAGLAAMVLVPWLQQATQDRQLEVRQAATASLQQLARHTLARALMSAQKTRYHRAVDEFINWSPASSWLLESTLHALIQHGLPGHRAFLRVLQDLESDTQESDSDDDDKNAAKIESLLISVTSYIPRLGKLSVLALPTLRRMMDSSVPQIRWAAAHTLDRLPNSLPTLRELLQHKARWIQEKAADVGQQLGAKAVLVMVEALSHSNPRVRQIATRSLGQYQEHHDTIIPSLAKRLHDSVDQVRVLAALSLMQLGATGQSALLQAMEQWPLHQLTPFLAKIPELPGHLLSARKRGQLLVALMKVLRNGETQEQMQGAQALVPLAAQASPLLPELRHLFTTSPNMHVRRAVAHALLSLGKHLQEAVHPLRDALKHPSADIQHLALQTLYELGPQAQPALAELLQSLQHDNTRRLAMMTLIKIGPTVVSALSPWLQHQNVQVRWAVVEILAGFQSPTSESRALLRQAANDSSSLVQTVAQRALQPTQDTSSPTDSSQTEPTSRPAPTSRPTSAK